MEIAFRADPDRPWSALCQNLLRQTANHSFWRKHRILTDEKNDPSSSRPLGFRSYCVLVGVRPVAFHAQSAEAAATAAARHSAAQNPGAGPECAAAALEGRPGCRPPGAS